MNMMKKELEYRFFKNGSEFHDWLIKESEKSPGIWMKFYKKHTNVECIEYQDALDEALCFGWIDSLVRRLDDKIYVRKFTPRRSHKNWSNLNKLHLKRLIAQKRVKGSGYSAVDPSVLHEIDSVEAEVFEKPKTICIPEFIAEYFKLNQPAYDNFVSLSQSYKLQYINWITGAKKQETINRRLEKSAIMLKEGQELGLK